MTPWKQRLIKRAIVLSQGIPAFRSRGSYSTALPAGETHAEAAAEYFDSANLLAALPDFDLGARIRGKTILDFGSGYGGRAVWYAERASFVEGIDIYPSMIERSQEFARSRQKTNVRFSPGKEDCLEFPSDHFDAIVSFDVLEHVERPDLIIPELYRVLKPGGAAILIFTPYYGMFSHHLNYITLLPALHWLFSPKDLVEAVNDLLETERFRSLRVQAAPPPQAVLPREADLSSDAQRTHEAGVH